MQRILSAPPRRQGFSLVEVLLAVTISMVLLYAAIFSASEAMAVVSEGDTQMHTHVQARRAMDRILKDVRYASQVEVGGDSETGWSLDVLTTGSLSAGWITYAWDANNGRLSVSNGVGTEWMLEGVRQYDLAMETIDVNGAPVVSGVILKWVVAEDSGSLAGESSMNQERETELSGSARLRILDL
ncbi:MAG: prepilin-type N-terminal cleavage/methylation domain-containing protein [Planctomycetota bacterium]|nr:prepilin-type N-terminal cleavage/methylation domain-containing protein [Planctomycetota bacterium]